MKSETERVKNKKPYIKLDTVSGSPLDEFASNLGGTFQASFRLNLVAKGKIDILSRTGGR